MTQPLAIDLFCGLGGWTSGLLAEGWRVVGFDITIHQYGEHKYPAQLVLQDVLTIHGSQFKTADLIVASPPCQKFSYMAMPWTRAKQLATEYRSGVRDVKQLTALFDACFRIQREACEAAGRHIPMVVENVRGANPWVGRSRYNYGSFHLWGDVPALMPSTFRQPLKLGIAHRPNGETNFHGIKQSGRTMCYPPGSANPEKVKGRTGKLHWLKDYSNVSINDGHKNPGSRFDGSGKSFQTESVNLHVKVPSEHGRRTAPGNGVRFTSRDCGIENGTKCGGDWFNADQPSISRLTSSKSNARKFASAMIAKIPEPLSRHIARVFKP